MLAFLHGRADESRIHAASPTFIFIFNKNAPVWGVCCYIMDMYDYEAMKSNPLAFVKRRTITSAYIDSTGRMGIAQTALMIQDNITGNFGEIDCDNFLLNKLGAYWVITRSKFHFYHRPFWRDKVHTVSFPVSNALVRANENTAIVTPEGEFLITANQEACCLDMQRHRPVKLTTLPFPREGFPAPVFNDNFEKFTVPDCEYKEIFKEKVYSQNIDTSHHMNNIEYIKVALNVLSVKEIEEREPLDLEVHYMGESMEGQTLSVRHAKVDGASYMKIFNEDERAVFEMKLTFR